MNTFERRMLEIIQSSSWIQSVARKDKKILGIEYYNYNTQIENVASQAQGQSTVQIQSDSDFVMTYLSASVVVTATGAIINAPFAFAQITDTGTGKTFFNQQTLVGLAFGNGGNPFFLPAPRVIAPNTNVQFSVTNNTGAAASFYFAMMGARVYYGG